MLTERDKLILAGVRRRHAARHARERAKSIIRRDRRADPLAASRAHRAMLKLYALADAEHRYYELHPELASLPALIDLAASLRHAVDDVRSRAAKSVGSLAADAMRLRMREDANLAMRLVRRIAAIAHSTRALPQRPQDAPKLAPITPPPMPAVTDPLYCVPDPSAPAEPLKSEYHWEKIVRRLDGSLADWQAQRKAALQRYMQSEKGKAARQRYMQSEKGKAARQRYMQSEKGKAARQRYMQSEKGKEALRRAQAARRAKQAAARQAAARQLDLFSLSEQQP